MEWDFRRAESEYENSFDLDTIAFRSRNGAPGTECSFGIIANIGMGRSKSGVSGHTCPHINIFDGFYIFWFSSWRNLHFCLTCQLSRSCKKQCSQIPAFDSYTCFSLKRCMLLIFGNTITTANEQTQRSPRLTYSRKM